MDSFLPISEYFYEIFDTSANNVTLTDISKISNMVWAIRLQIRTQVLQNIRQEIKYKGKPIEAHIPRWLFFPTT